MRSVDGAIQCAERSHDGVDRRCDVCLSAPEGREPECRQFVLQRSEILAAKCNEMGEVLCAPPVHWVHRVQF